MCEYGIAFMKLIADNLRITKIDIRNAEMDKLAAEIEALEAETDADMKNDE